VANRPAVGMALKDDADGDEKGGRGEGGGGMAKLSPPF